MKETKRAVGYDIVRVVAMLFVIALHTNPKPYQNGSFGQELFLSVFYACNGLFFMLSGRFALAEKLDGVREILKYYKNKLFTLFIPLLIFGGLSFWVDFYKSEKAYTAGTFFLGLLKGVLGDWNDGYLWFMFALVGLTLGAPFLGKMVRHMSNNELHLLAAVGLLWEIFSVYIGKNAGLGFGYNSWFLLGFSYYYYLGYYAHRTWENASSKKFLIIAGFVAFAVNAIWTFKMPYYSYNAHDLAPLYTLYVVGLYLLLGSIKLRPEGRFAKFIFWVAQQSYFVYLLHRILLKLWINGWKLFPSKAANYIVHYLICVICSVLVAFLLNLAYKPLLKRIKKPQT